MGESWLARKTFRYEKSFSRLGRLQGTQTAAHHITQFS